MRAKEVVKESKVIRTGQGAIYEQPNKNTIIKLLQNEGGVRGIVMYDEVWVANAFDMIHADIAINVGLSTDYATPENADLFMFAPRGDNKYELDIFGPDITYEDMPRSVKQTVEYLRRHGYTVQVTKDDRMLHILEPYVNETASAGATAAGAVATVNQPALAVQRRTGPYMNHTVVGPDGKPIKQLGGKKKKKKKKKESLNEGKLYKLRGEPIIENPNKTQLENLAQRSKWDSLRITLDNRMIMWAWPADDLTHRDVEEYLEKWYDEDFEAQEQFNFTLMRSKDGVTWRVFADNEIADWQSFNTMMSIPKIERAIGDADFDSSAGSDFWAPNRWGM